MIETLSFDDDNVEVIVVDNASQKDEATAIAQRYPKVRVVCSDKNLGFAGGNNLGIKSSRGKYLFFLNNDTLLYLGDGKGKQHAYEGLHALINHLETHKDIGIVCPKIRFAWGNHPLQYAGYTPLSRFTMRNHSVGFGEDDHGQYDTAHSTPYAHGAAMMVKREAIEKTGLMPECYFLYYEELDWSMMMRRAGYDIWYEPTMTVYHKESQSTGQKSPLRTYYITRNRLLFVRRNVPVYFRWLSYLYLIGVVSLKDCILFTIHKRPDLAKATIKGLCHFLKPSAS